MTTLQCGTKETCPNSPHPLATLTENWLQERRLVTWGMSVEDHLFFERAYTEKIWTMVMSCCNLKRKPLTWSRELEQAIKHLGQNSFETAILRLGVVAVVYQVWLERNARVFSSNARDFRALLSLVGTDTRNRIASLKNVGKTSRNWSLCLAWNIPREFQLWSIRPLVVFLFSCG